MQCAKSWRVTAVAIALGMSAPSQDYLDYLDLPWRINDEGLLEVQEGMPPTGGGRMMNHADWSPMFPGLFVKGPLGEPAGFGELPGLGPIAALPLLLHGHGGAAAIDEAGHRLRKLGIRIAIDRDMMRAVRPDPLVDLLRVRRIAESGVASGFTTLRDFAKDDRRDVFVRAAAAMFVKRYVDTGKFTAYGDWQASLTSRNGAAALQAGLSRLPDDTHIVLGVHCAAVPTMGRLLAAWRKVQLSYASMGSSLGGGNLSRGVLGGLQRRFDMPGQLPYELAVRFGNWRVDYALLAVRCGPVDTCWVHLGGLFQPALIAKGLRVAGCEVRLSDDGELVADVYGWRVRATPAALEVWPSTMKIGARGGRLADLHAWADPGRAAVTALVPPTSPLASALGLVGGGLQVRFDPGTMRVTAEATCSGPQTAALLRDQWTAWQGKRRFDPGDEIPGQEGTTWGQGTTWGELTARIDRLPGSLLSVLAWRRCVQATEVSVDKAKVHWRCDLTRFPLTDLVRLLSAPPRVVIEHW